MRRASSATKISKVGLRGSIPNPDAQIQRPPGREGTLSPTDIRQRGTVSSPFFSPPSLRPSSWFAQRPTTYSTTGVYETLLCRCSALDDATKRDSRAGILWRSGGILARGTRPLGELVDLGKKLKDGELTALLDVPDGFQGESIFRRAHAKRPPRQSAGAGGMPG